MAKMFFLYFYLTGLNVSFDVQ